MSKLEAFEEFKDHWREFCSDVLADKGTRGVYRGAAAVFLAMGDFLLDQIEETIDLDDEEEEDEESDEASDDDESGDEP